MTCELCGEREAEMDFNVLTPFALVEGDVCLACWSGIGDDAGVAVALLKRRAEKRGVELSLIQPEVFAALCKREGAP